MPPNRLTWMVVRAMAAPVGVALLVVLGIALLGVAGRVAAEPLVRALPPQLLVALLASLIAPLLPAVLPVALFAGLVAGVARLETDGTVDAARALGVAPRQLVAPTLVLALGVGLVTAAAGAWGEPWGRYRARHALDGVDGPDLDARAAPLTVAAEGSVLGARAVEADGTLIDVLLWRDEGNEIVMAPRAQVTLGDGRLTAVLFDGEVHRRLETGYLRARFGRYQASVPLPLVRRTGHEPFELAPGPLLDTIRARRAEGHEVRFHQLALHRRIAIPLAVPLLALLAWPLGRSRGGSGAARGFLAAVVVGLGYYLTLRLGDHGLRQLHWPAWIAAYLGTAGLAAAATAGWWWRWRR